MLTMLFKPYRDLAAREKAEYLEKKKSMEG
jgi:hypothetical protein